MFGRRKIENQCGVPQAGAAAPAEKKRRFDLNRWQRSSLAVKPWVAIVGTIPALVMIVLFGLIPAMVNVVVSFTNYNGLVETMKFVGLRNYVEFFTVIGRDVLPAFWTTIKYALITVIPLQILAIGSALLVNNRVKGRNFFRALYFMPNILGAVVVCFAWKLIFDTRWGPLIGIFRAMGLETAFLGDPKISLLCVSVITLWANYGFYMTIYLAGLTGISHDYYEAASLDGASGWALFCHITFPLLRPSLTICLWLAISNALGLTDVILLTTNGEYGTETIGFYIYRTVMYNSNTQGLNAAVTIYNFLFVSTIMLLFNKFIRRKEVEL